jgi:outer membrane receptor protein involved in Fe transport
MNNGQRNKSTYGLVILLVMVLSLFANTQEKKKIEKYFKMDLYELMGIEMTTAGQQKEKISEIPASVVLVTREDIKRYGYMSLEEILQNIPGLYMIDDYNWMGTKNFGVRGFFSTGAFNDLIVLINGVNQVENEFDSYFSEKISVPVEAIDRIEVIRGPMSVIYGSGAFFGAINIITDDKDKKNPISIISASAGNLETYKIFARVSGKKGDFRYSFNASIFEENGIDEPFDKMMTDSSPVTLPPPYGWNLSSDSTGGLLKTKRKYFNFVGQFKDFSIKFGGLNSEKNTVETIFGAGDGTTTFLNSAHASLNYKKNLSDVVSLEGEFTYSHDNHWLDNEFFVPNSYTNNLFRMDSYEIELNAFINPSPNLNITFGLFRHTSSVFGLVDYPLFGGNNIEIHSEKATTHALFSQITYTLSKKLKFVAGVRLEKPEDYKFEVFLDAVGFEPPVPLEYLHKPGREVEFIPRVALIYSINDKNIFKLLYGKAIKQPARSTDFDLVFSPGQPLKAAEIQTFELNYIAAFSKKLLINFSIFRNDLNNLISRTNVVNPESGDVTFMSTNAGKMHTTGVELGILATIGKKLELDLSATYQSSENRRAGFENIQLGYSPKILGYIKSSYAFSKKITLAITGIYVDKMESGWDLVNNLDEFNHPIIREGDPYRGRLGLPVGSYFNLNANLRIDKLFNTGCFLNARVSNLFDEEIHYPATTSNPLFDKGTLGYGRRFIVTLGYEF